LKTEMIKAAILAFAIFAIYLFESILLVSRVLSRLKIIPRRKRGRAFRIAAICLHVVAAAGILCALYAVLIEPRWIEVVNVDVPTERLKHATLTVAQISDLHCDAARCNEDEVVRIINDLRPDIIVFTGDAVNSPEGLPLFRDTLSRLKANIGKFAVRGNVDRNYSDEELVGGTGFQMLNDKHMVCTKDGESFCITGISEKYIGQAHAVLSRAHLHAGRDTFTIFLHHYPHLVDDVYPGFVDLSLSGHTHGGQIALPFYGAVMTFSPAGKKYERGAYHTRGALLYVNRGIGTENTPVRARFLARPEITVFHIHPAAAGN